MYGMLVARTKFGLYGDTTTQVSPLDEHTTFTVDLMREN